MDAEGNLLEWGGCCDRYGLSELQRGAPAADQVDCLAGILPLCAESLCIPFVQLAPDTYADIHIITSRKCGWVILLDSSAEVRRLTLLQQNSNELTLLREKEAELLDQLRSSHQNLLSVLEQLRLTTVVISEDGTIDFLSRPERHLMGSSRGKIRNRSWDKVLNFREKDKDKLRKLLESGSGPHDRLLARTRAAGARQHWIEIDVHIDPRDKAKRILYIYDVSEVHDLREKLEKSRFSGIVGKGGEMEKIFTLIRDLSGMETTVLIEGETGTGKELAARAIHYASRRKEHPFITVNCAGLNDSLISSQLFGHRKGSFTDAVCDQQGLFEAANGGTLFLDEIGDIPMNTQARILRALEEREVIRIGETRPRKIDIRILAATNKDLDRLVQRGLFRLDLLYRIRVARVLLPPLRKRREDIPLLVQAFLVEARNSTRKAVKAVSTEAMRVLMDYRWPGNVRELRNAIEFGVVRSRGTELRPMDLPPELTYPGARVSTRRPYSVETETGRILDALRRTGGRRTEAARLLGISRATLYRRMKACLVDFPQPTEDPK